MSDDPYSKNAAARRKNQERVVFMADRALLKQFDEVAAAKGYNSRAEALRAGITEVVEKDRK